ncbi:alpha-1,4-glucan--maltose-1-phosphate maltosyltransferase [Immundisolibacter sp.]|uniref:alpha-1,4-glucan--maltose-1-phosphate maltosyltransferase n=1 Tax=Immundisolibacter sp. TaxID=1934948 RepID=UPI002B0F7B60|nr:alpha-1,4-glucan--maltose-1-phosphate maltosyltransferase [Immundisolibacter sp.]MEA3220865.1 Alpha-1,4-glucan:maltose-1-phosphate maltosyltransferase 1 [Immundisolibacter sp.]
MIRDVQPRIECGRYPVKRVAGDRLRVSAEIFRDGHDLIAGVLKLRPADAQQWQEIPLTSVNPGLDRWEAEVELARNTTYRYTIEAWPDAYGSWRADTLKKLEAGQDLGLEALEGRALLETIAARAKDADAAALRTVLERLTSGDDALAVLLAEDTLALARRCPDRSEATVYAPELEVVVDRERARFAAWYEMFPRSQGTDPTRSATFAECAARLPEIAHMGFDVVYLVPIHPIGRIHRKGSNNSLNPGPDDPGSPYAIGADEGGHDAVHPDLGTLDDFRAFVARAGELGMEVALDFAIQCAPDHPWVREHPEWFSFRPDGSIRYAENPPKKYQDIVNLDMTGPHRAAIWDALREVIEFWIAQGVKTFRVDNPHTKPVAFWEWLIGTIRARHPEVVFLAEAFTRPPMLKTLARVGFTQSYTYFTWRNSKQELTEYLTELTQTECREYLRPNFFANTPDILPPILQHGGPGAFRIRAVLAATLSSVYGIYNGFELCEGRAVPGTEEYQDSEKYQYKVWDWDRPGHIKDYLTRLNRVRRANPALHDWWHLRFLPGYHDGVLCYLKTTAQGDQPLVIAVSLDPHQTIDCEIELPLDALRVDPGYYTMQELMTGTRHQWSGPRQWVHLTPEQPAWILRPGTGEGPDGG